MSKPRAIVEVIGLSKSFKVGTQDVLVLKEISFNIKEEDFIIIFGPSGSGKSTLLHSLLGLEEPSQGKVIFLGKDIYLNTDEDARSDFRKKTIGMVYQQSNWIKALNVRENVAFPLLLLGQDIAESSKKALELLERVGMKEWSEYLPTELSSGQQQRVALARALINDPAVIIADEPTGNLDFESGQTIMQLLSDLNKNDKKLVIMVTHDLGYIEFANSVIRMLDGKVVEVYGLKDKNRLLNELKSKMGAVSGKKRVGNVSVQESLDKKVKLPEVGKTEEVKQ